MPRKETNTSSITAQAQQDAVSDGIENFELPKSLITKIARSAIPENAKLQKETILSLVKGSTVFINYLAATAHDVALSKQHKSISATDVLRALEVMELGDLVQNLQEELQVYRELSKTDKTKRATSSVAPVPRTTPGIKLVGSVSAPAPTVPTIKIKGKEKATTPFTSTPLETPPSESISTGPIAMDVDQEVVEEEEEEIAEEEEIVDEEQEEDEEEELQDTVALEEEELRKDAKGLDDTVGLHRPEVPQDDDKMME
ncbi:histone-fold-containing protein [Desarmillaria tabescens]|uniref:DNA polymerase epsilon subunit D n=1 Tax=Armillaria tabescens TaxID=1929756 RepID=A0AA39NDT8_ARMTA|nr:histone-fold-containing protein [Desarmillaria tabescens]KAK0463816.1 histone-fold-containing protein [Desarmillaria tabescens]